MQNYDSFGDREVFPRPSSGGPVRALAATLRWQNAQAKHVECRVFPAPREPGGVAGVPMDGEPLRLNLAPGELVPEWRADQLLTVPGQFFRRSHGALTLEPRTGRFFPGAFLRGAPNLPPGPPAFRITDVAADRHLTADFNHPLAGLPLELELRALALPVPGEHSANPGKSAVTNGPGMQARWRGQPTDFWPGGSFLRADEAADADFYARPRLVQHLDDTALGRIRDFYRNLLPRDGAILDLMSSWTSHLDPAVSPVQVAGLGMNAEELAANPVLTERVVQDLNLDPRLPWPDHSFDAVVCTVSVEYLVRPVEVFREVRRVLRPGGYFLVTFSNRWFPPKAISLWQELHEFERMGLVLEFFFAAGGFGNLGTWSLQGLPRPAGDKYAGRLPFSDPVYAVWGQAAGA